MLRIKLKKDERIMINGAVIRWNDTRIGYIYIENTAEIIRERDIIQAEEADTPVRRAYFAAQNILLGVSTSLGDLAPFKAQIERLRSAFKLPGHVALLEAAENGVDQGNIYKALTSLRELAVFEAAVLNHALPPKLNREKDSGPDDPQDPEAARPVQGTSIPQATRSWSHRQNSRQPRHRHQPRYANYD